MIKSDRLLSGAGLLSSAAALAIMLSGCAGRKAPPPPSEHVRGQLGTVIVECVSSSTQARLAKPDTKGAAAAKGAVEGMFAAGGATAGATGGGELGVILELAFLPVGAVVGSVVGVIQGSTKAEIRAAEASLIQALQEMNFHESVRQNVIKVGKQLTRHPFLEADDPALSSGLPAHSSILQINVRRAGLAGSSKKNAPLSIFLDVEVRLLSCPDRTPIYQRAWIHKGGARTFNSWAADAAQAFRAELALASGAVAESVVEEIFLRYRPD